VDNAVACRQRGQLDATAIEKSIAGNEEGIGPLAHDCGERPLDFKKANATSISRNRV
jgi:hypothetical protein